MLPDGTYDVVVVDVEEVDGGVRLDLTLVAGERKGEVVTVTAAGLAGDPIDLLGLPGTLAVRDGRPHFTAEP